jgi:hypothetical protein
MASEIPLTLQTAYADLLDRSASAAFSRAFAEDGVFTPKTVRGRRYWYFQVTREDGTRKQRYVGPETPELLERITTHKEARSDQRDRHALVSTLVRSARLPRPEAPIGQIVEALAEAGVFRLRGVLVGTVAYQTYSAMLGIRLPLATVQTGDVDIAQFRNVSVAVEEKVPAILDTLKKVDSSFRAVPHMHNQRSVTSYVAKRGIRVDFLTPNEGPETDAPAPLPALGTDAQQLRFLDLLIHDPEPAVLLYGEGIYVLVPSPQRYAVHKLIIARRRSEGAAKIDKDLRQAEALLDALVRKRPHELRSAWHEAFGRGRKWQQLIGEGLGLINPSVRDSTLKIVGAPRSIIPRLDLKFSAPHVRYDLNRDIVAFSGEAGGGPVHCAISGEALEDHFGADGVDQDGRLKIFRANRSMFEKMARTKYLSWPVEDIGSVLIRTDDVPDLHREMPPGSYKHDKLVRS